MSWAIVNIYEKDGLQWPGLPAYTRGQASARASATERNIGGKLVYRIIVRERAA